MKANEKRNPKGSNRPIKRRRSSGFLQFPEARGKTVQLIELDPEASAVVILFTDSTALSFDVDSCHAIFPQLCRRKDGNWTPLKSWRAVKSSFSMAE